MEVNDVWFAHKSRVRLKKTIWRVIEDLPQWGRNPRSSWPTVAAASPTLHGCIYRALRMSHLAECPLCLIYDTPDHPPPPSPPASMPSPTPPLTLLPSGTHTHTHTDTHTILPSACRPTRFQFGRALHSCVSFRKALSPLFQLLWQRYMSRKGLLRGRQASLSLTSPISAADWRVTLTWLWLKGKKMKF